MILKKISGIVIGLMSLVFSLMSLTSHAQEGIGVEVNGKSVEFDQQPVIIDDHVLVPLRKICDEIGAEIYYSEWDGVQAITTVKSNTTVMMIKGILSVEESIKGSWRLHSCEIPEGMNDYIPLANKKRFEKPMEVQPVILNDRLCVPVRVLTENLGAKVEWDGDRRCVLIECENTEFDRSEDERVQSENFDYAKAKEIFMNLDVVKKAKESNTLYDGWYLGEGYNETGKIFAFICLPYKEIIISSDGNVVYNTGEEKAEQIPEFAYFEPKGLYTKMLTLNMPYDSGLYGVKIKNFQIYRTSEDEREHTLAIPRDKETSISVCMVEYNYNNNFEYGFNDMYYVTETLFTAEPGNCLHVFALKPEGGANLAVVSTDKRGQQSIAPIQYIGADEDELGYRGYLSEHL